MYETTLLKLWVKHLMLVETQILKEYLLAQTEQKQIFVTKKLIDFTRL